MLVPLLILLVILAACTAVAFLVLNKPNKPKPLMLSDAAAGTKNPKDNVALLNDAMKRLEKNPHDVGALLMCGDLYYKTEDWQKAFNIYQILCTMPAGQPQADDYEIHFRCAEAAEQLGLLNDAFKCYLVATSFNDRSYKAIYGLGSIEFKRENYEKAIGHLTKVRGLNPDFAPALCVLGHANFKLKKYKEAMINIRRALEIRPGDKETLFTLAECYAEAGQSDQALRIYSHLRADPDVGPDACLKSGMIHSQSNQLDNAITDFEIGLKHAKLKPETLLELKYQIGNLSIKKNDIPKAIQFLKEVQAEKPDGYKETALLISQYADLSTNQNLQIYVMAQPAEFLALCRKIVMTYYPKTRVKITQTNVEGREWADILAEIDTVKWSDIIGFRFVRTQGNIGELVVRDFHAHLKDVKAGKGICFGIGAFTDEAKRFTEARLIELVEKTRLTDILAKVDDLAREALDAKKNAQAHR